MKNLKNKLSLFVALLVTLMMQSCVVTAADINPSDPNVPTMSTVKHVTVLAQNRAQILSMANGLTEDKMAFVSSSNLLEDSWGLYYKVDWHMPLNKGEGFKRRGYLIPLVACDEYGVPYKVGNTYVTFLVNVQNPAYLPIDQVIDVYRGQNHFSNVAPDDMGAYGRMAAETATNLTVPY